LSVGDGATTGDEYVLACLLDLVVVCLVVRTHVLVERCSVSDVGKLHAADTNAEVGNGVGSVVLVVQIDGPFRLITSHEGLQTVGAVRSSVAADSAVLGREWAEDRGGGASSTRV